MKTRITESSADEEVIKPIGARTDYVIQVIIRRFISRRNKKMFGVCLLVFIGLCIYHASEPTIPADYHRNWKLEREDANKVRFGEMSQRQFEKNIRNGKYK